MSELDSVTEYRIKCAGWDNIERVGEVFIATALSPKKVNDGKMRFAELLPPNTELRLTVFADLIQVNGYTLNTEKMPTPYLASALIQNLVDFELSPIQFMWKSLKLIMYYIGE